VDWHVVRYAGAGQLCVEGLLVEITRSQYGRLGGNFREDRFRAIVAVEQTVLRTLLIVDHEIEGDAGIARPARMGRLGAIAAEVAFASVAQGSFPAREAL